MSEINVKPPILTEQVSDWKKLYMHLKNYENQLDSIKNSFNMSGDAGALIKKSLNEADEQLESIIITIRILYKILEQIVNAYIKSEQSISNTNIITSPNMPFDDQGQYGGYQGNPQTHYKDLADIVRKYYPDFSDKEVEDYLKKLADEGCGYVAMTNTIFSQFEGKEDEFEKTFGFPMYDENGELNYDAMVTDFYSAMDNHNKDGINESEDPSSTDGKGTTREKREYRWETYMKDHGIDVDVKDVDVTPDTYEEIAKDGYLVIGVSPVVLYDENGNEVYNKKGGHAMTVTGVTDDGMYIVSSWGEKFYIKPDDNVYNRMQFQQVQY